MLEKLVHFAPKGAVLDVRPYRNEHDHWAYEIRVPNDVGTYETFTFPILFTRRRDNQVMFLIAQESRKFFGSPVAWRTRIH